MTNAIQQREPRIGPTRRRRSGGGWEGTPGPPPTFELVTQAVVVAAAAVTDRPAWIVAIAVIVTLSLPLHVHRYGLGVTFRLAPRHIVAASLVRLASVVTGGLGTAGVGDSEVVLRTLAGGLGYSAFEAFERRRGRRPPLRETWPLDLGLACSAALLALAYHRGGLLFAPIALVPLVISRFSYARYALARDAFRQTVAALAVVPEVAGLVAVGHNERTARYAEAMCELLGLPPATRERVAAAARLHHVGALTVPGADEEVSYLLTAEVIDRGADVVRATGLPEGVARILTSLRAVDRPMAGDCGLEAAIVSVASDFDDLVGAEPRRAPWALSLLGMHAPDASTRVALAALEHVVSAGAHLPGADREPQPPAAEHERSRGAGGVPT